MFGKKDNALFEVAPDNLDLKIREDRLYRYFKINLNRFIFAEFSPEYLARTKVADIMNGVSIPLRKEDLEGFQGGEGLSAGHLAENLTWVMGCDPHFLHVESYVEYFKKLYNQKACESILKKGRDAAEAGELEKACIYFRACLCIKPDYLHGMYSYARACRALYMDSKDPEYVGSFKAEAMDFFELTTLVHPRFAQSYYYLGYAYLNLGLYLKAELTWKAFLKLSNNREDIKEIKERLEQIKEPIQIEEGYTAVMAGRYEEGILIMEPFLDSRFQTWWPLHYYLGVAYERMGYTEKAKSSFKKVLGYNGSHLETMEELAKLHEAAGETEQADKYRRKVKLVEDNLRKNNLL